MHGKKRFVIFALSILNRWLAGHFHDDFVSPFRCQRHIHNKKAFSERFGFDALRISQIQTDSQEQSNGNAPFRYILRSILYKDSHVQYIRHRGASALFGWTIRAMREPSKRGPGSRRLHAFCVYGTDVNH